MASGAAVASQDAAGGDVGATFVEDGREAGEPLRGLSATPSVARPTAFVRRPFIGASSLAATR